MSVNSQRPFVGMTIFLHSASASERGRAGASAAARNRLRIWPKFFPPANSPGSVRNPRIRNSRTTSSLPTPLSLRLRVATPVASLTIPTGPCRRAGDRKRHRLLREYCARQRFRLCRAAVVRPVLWRQRAALCASGRRGVQHAVPERADVRWRLAQQHLCNRQFAAITGRRHAGRLGRARMLELDLVVSGPQARRGLLPRLLRPEQRQRLRVVRERRLLRGVRQRLSGSGRLSGMVGGGILRPAARRESNESFACDSKRARSIRSGPSLLWVSWRQRSRGRAPTISTS